MKNTTLLRKKEKLYSLGSIVPIVRPSRSGVQITFWLFYVTDMLYVSDMLFMIDTTSFGTIRPFPVREITSENLGGRTEADFRADRPKYI